LQAGRYAAGVARFDFDRELAPYDLNRYGQWAALSSFISSTVLHQLLPVSLHIGSGYVWVAAVSVCSPALLATPHIFGVSGIVTSGCLFLPIIHKLLLIGRTTKQLDHPISLLCCVSHWCVQPGGEISIMSEAVDPGLMNPASAAEKRLQKQLEVRLNSVRQRISQHSTARHSTARLVLSLGMCCAQSRSACTASRNYQTINSSYTVLVQCHSK
jgi:hypothetical protein